MRRIGLKLIAMAMVIASGAFAFGQQPPSSGRACFFQGINFTGASFCLSSGQVINNLHDYAGWNDSIASISVQGYINVTICVDADFNGQCQVINSSVYNMAYLGSNWMKTVSSIQVVDNSGGWMPPPPPPPPPQGGSICFYQGYNFTGPSFCLNQGQSIDNLHDYDGWNDTISSIYVNGFGYMGAKICVDAHFSGACTTISSSIYNMNQLGAGWDRTISSIQVY